MTINLRKNIARFIYIIDQTTNVDSRANILKELDLTENEFQELAVNLLRFSNSADKDGIVVILNTMDSLKHSKLFQKKQIQSS